MFIDPAINEPRTGGTGRGKSEAPHPIGATRTIIKDVFLRRISERRGQKRHAGSSGCRNAHQVGVGGPDLAVAHVQCDIEETDFNMASASAEPLQADNGVQPASRGQ